MNKFLVYIFSALYCLSGVAQQPRLVVGIVVDQMSNDYINRFWDQYSDGGFKRMAAEGFSFHNTNYNFVPTHTGCGHASIFSGGTPSDHGISGNHWLDKMTGKLIYCVEDNSVNAVGSQSDAGKRSPANFYGSSVSDMLRLHNNSASKVIGIALKDRSAILPVGRMANGAYWWENDLGKWITSDYYVSAMPKWVEDFEKTNPAADYLKVWEPVISQDRVKLYADHNIHEASITKGGSTDFPYNLKVLFETEGYAPIKSSPFGDLYTIDFTKAAIKGENLGADDITDFLSVSFSSTDYVGHQFGPYSAEIEDAYVRLDLLLASFLEYLDKEIGRDKYVVVLTADHGVMPNAGFLNSKKINAQKVDYSTLEESLNDALFKAFQVEKLIMGILNDQVYLDVEKIKVNKIKKEEAARKVAEYLNAQEFIQTALSAHDLIQKEFSEFPKKQMQNGYYKDRSGDVMFVLKPFYDEADYVTGAGHGKPYIFDTHVPLLFFGPGFVKHGDSYDNVEITQIAPTLCDLLKIQRPPYATDNSLYEKLK